MLWRMISLRWKTLCREDDGDGLIARAIRDSVSDVLGIYREP